MRPATDRGAVTPTSLLARHAADKSVVFAIVVDGGGTARTITYAEQLRRTRTTAAALTSLGVAPGDRVHLQARNCLEFYDIWFATGLIGATLVPTNPESTPDELRHVLEDAAPRLSILQDPTSASAPGVRTVLLDDPDPNGEGGGSFSELVARADATSVAVRARCRPGDVAAILYTSGTTSRPKGVLVTHTNYVEVGSALARHLSMTAGDRWLIALPLFHANAQYYCTMSALVSGASVVLAPRFSASAWETQAARYDVTLGSLFAAPIRMILSRPPVERPRHLRAVLFAQNLADAQAEEFEQRVGARLLQLYGMTETVLPPTINPDSDERRWGSVGRPLPGVEVRVADSDGRSVPAGAVGELRVGGEVGRTIAGGYLDQPESTEATFAGSWLRTGDLMRVDVDGFYYFVDRAKDMIKRSGENIAASEIERVVGEHPAVFECAAVGVPDPMKDEAIIVFVVLQPDRAAEESDLDSWCQQRMAKFKVPSRFVFVDGLPRTSVGKIRKEELRRSASV